MQSRRIAVLADCVTRRKLLYQLLSCNGWQVVLNIDPAQLTEASLPNYHPDIWLVALESSALPSLLDNRNEPLLVSEGWVPEPNCEHYLPWVRRLLRKLTALTASPQPIAEARTTTTSYPSPSTVHPPAQHIWLLAASTGGPSAVKGFLDALPANLPLALLYAQHIDSQFESLLPQVIGRNNRWRIARAQQNQMLSAGEVVIVPVAHELSFSQGGLLHIQEHGWSGVWRPSFSQMMQNLARHFSSRCGVIVFSGMNNDCTAALSWIKHQGVPIWTQSATSCACPDMPASLCAAGYSKKSAPPAQLAEALALHLQQHQASRMLVELP